MVAKCTHSHGAQVKALNAWVCGKCFDMLQSRPTRYSMLPPPITPDGSGLTVARQEIVWQAEVRKSPEGTTLDTFLRSMARRFMSRDKSLETFEAHKIALDVLKGMGAQFGDQDYCWDRASAIDITDEEMSYWDEEVSVGNGQHERGRYVFTLRVGGIRSGSS